MAMAMAMDTAMDTLKNLEVMYSDKQMKEILSKSTILVTGGAGFIGSHLCDFFVKNGAKRVCALDNLVTGFKSNIEHLLSEPNFEFIEGGIEDQVICHKACYGIDVVLHHAALGSVPRSIEDPIATNLVNVGGFVNMLVAAKEKGVKKFIYASSSSVYGDDQTFPKTETKTGNLLSPYAVSKFTNEKYAAVFSNLYGIQTIGFRYFNVFGERQNPNGAYAAVIPKFIDSVIKDSSPNIYGTGNNTRDFTYVANVVNANLLAITNEQLPISLVMNIACGGTISVNSIYDLIANYLEKSELRPNYVEERKGEIKDSFADISLANHYLGYQPIISVEEGIKKTVDWFNS